MPKDCAIPCELTTPATPTPSPPIGLFSLFVSLVLPRTPHGTEFKGVEIAKQSIGLLSPCPSLCWIPSESQWEHWLVNKPPEIPSKRGYDSNALWIQFKCRLNSIQMPFEFNSNAIWTPFKCHLNAQAQSKHTFSVTAESHSNAIWTPFKCHLNENPPLKYPQTRVKIPSYPCGNITSQKYQSNRILLPLKVSK